jgi:hypothetical protein
MNSISNPEFLRYVRSELRPARVAVIVLSTLLGSLLMGLFIYQQNGNSAVSPDYWHSVCLATFTAASIILVLWSLLNVSQSVVSERTQRTFDFWRTTRLSPMTLALGKLFGAPLAPWLLYATVLPVVLFTGFMAGLRFSALVGSYLVVALFNVALSAIALCGSARAQDARRATLFMLLAVIGLLPMLNVSVGMHYGAVGANAWSAVNPAMAVIALLEGTVVRVSLFGMAVPSLLVTVLLSLATIAWCLVALVRCIKFEPDQISLFSPVQVVGVSASFLLFVYAAFRPVAPWVTAPNIAPDDLDTAQLTLQALIATGIGAAIGCLYFTANSTLLTRDNLRQQLRKRAPMDVALRTVAPWLATGVVSLIAAVLALSGYRHMFAGAVPQWFSLIAMYLSVIAYVVRDGMFLQWMVSQKVKAPVLKGSALLIFYYVASFVVSAVMAGPQNMLQMLRWLVPYISVPMRPEPSATWMIVPLLIPPIATAALLAFGVFRSMKRSSQAATALASA